MRILIGTTMLNGKYRAMLEVEGECFVFNKEFDTEDEAIKYGRSVVERSIENTQEKVVWEKSSPDGTMIQ